ncbi:nucleoside deaminase [Pseudovibrio exalbescens]|uniref:nucleoside deaminase n=1 Tax=Pseudovibrio exalbescens TaxID=197461 RepID=UPI002366EB05|nr:nucleoside deaminase [Pseudovibrio exalbescens]MDD7910808.1 nucleoside deaminase [Pseudovibrio exalbescens]
MPSKTEHDVIHSLVQQAVDMSIEHVEKGGIPFTALIADQNGKVYGSGVNRVSEDHDPTAHAEVVAIRNACKHRQHPSLSGLTLIASGEPCALCYMAALYSGVSRIVYAVDRDGAAQGGFNYSRSYEIFAVPTEHWAMRPQLHEVENGFEPFRMWLAKSSFMRF